MPRVKAVRNPYSSNCRCIMLGRGVYSFPRSAATGNKTDVSLRPVGCNLGRSQLESVTGRTLAPLQLDSVAPHSIESVSTRSALQRSCADRKKHCRISALRRECSIECHDLRFNATSDHACFEETILRRCDGRIRGMKPWR